MALTITHTHARTAPRRGAFWKTLMNRHDLARQRRALGALDTHLLNDIGLTEDQAGAEARRPGWDAPDHWRR